MAILTKEEFKEYYEKQKVTVVGTCAYGPCSQPVFAADHREENGEKVYHFGCFQMNLDDELSAEIERNPIMHGIRRHTLVAAMGELD